MENVSFGASQSLSFDLSSATVRQLNQHLHGPATELADQHVEVFNPDGAHNLAVGINAPVKVAIHGHAGYYAAGMNKFADVTIEGSASTGAAENMMSGKVHIKGFASNSAGASAHGGLLVIDGGAGLRCGISLKGGDIVVGGSVGSFSGFMAQAGRMVVCGHAGDALGDSLYEAVIYVRGDIKSLGADAQIEPLQDTDISALTQLLQDAGFDHDPARACSCHWAATATPTSRAASCSARRPTTRRWARRPASATTATPANARWA